MAPTNGQRRPLARSASRPSVSRNRGQLYRPVPFRSKPPSANDTSEELLQSLVEEIHRRYVEARRRKGRR